MENGLLGIASPLFTVAFARQRFLGALLFTRFQVERMPLDFLDDVFSLHLALKTPSALSRVSPSWTCTSANRNSPASRIWYEVQDSRSGFITQASMIGCATSTGLRSNLRPRLPSADVSLPHAVPLYLPLLNLRKYSATLGVAGRDAVAGAAAHLAGSRSAEERRSWTSSASSLGRISRAMRASSSADAVLPTLRRERSRLRSCTSLAQIRIALDAVAQIVHLRLGIAHQDCRVRWERSPLGS